MLVALAFRLPELDRPPHFDELYHVLAARSWLATGELAIGDGVYDRAAGFTLLVAQAMRTFGDSLAAARVPALLFGCLGVLAVFLTIDALAGTTAAAISAVLFAIDPLSITMSLFTRFYTAHGLAFWILAALLFVLVARRPRRTLWKRIGLLGGLAVAFFCIAWYLQRLTLIGVLALSAWALLHLLPRTVSWARRSSPRAVALAGCASIAIGAAALAGGFAAGLDVHFRWSAIWASPHADDVQYYHRWMQETYPVFWTLVPLAMAVAISSRPAVGLWLSTTFGVGFVLLSLAGMKSPRYAYFALPFFFALWGVALADLLPALHRRGSRAFAAIVARRPALQGAGRLERGLAAAALAFSALLVLDLQGGSLRFVDVAAHPFAVREHAPDPWLRAAEVLAPRLRDGSVVLTTKDLFALYYLGRYDLQVSASRVENAPEHEEFAVDPRTGRRAISKAESLRRVIACHPSGLFVSDLERWKNPYLGIDATAAAVLEAKARRQDLPPDLPLVVYTWDHAAGPLDPVTCLEKSGTARTARAPSDGS